MVNVYWLHSGWLAAVEPPALLSGVSGAFDEEQAASTLVTVSSTAAKVSRNGLWDMTSPARGMREMTSSVLACESEVSQERRAQFFASDARFPLGGGEAH